MPKEKVDKAQKTSKFHDFEKTATKKGIVSRFGKMPSSFGDGSQFFYYMVLEDGTLIAINSVIGRKLRYASTELGNEIVGDKIEVTFQGHTKTKSGQKLNLFDISLNGKIIDENIVTGEEMKNLFAGSNENDDLPF